MKVIPAILFAYARPDHLRRTLACLRENRVPLIYAFSDGPRTPDKAPSVEQVRQIALLTIPPCQAHGCAVPSNSLLATSCTLSDPRAGLDGGVERRWFSRR